MKTIFFILSDPNVQSNTNTFFFLVVISYCCITKKESNSQIETNIRYCIMFQQWESISILYISAIPTDRCATKLKVLIFYRFIK